MKRKKFRYKYFPTGSAGGCLQVFTEAAVSIFHKDSLSNNREQFSTLHLSKTGIQGPTPDQEGLELKQRRPCAEPEDGNMRSQLQERYNSSP